MKKKENAIAVVGLGQSDIPKLLEKVVAQIKAIKGDLPEVPKTTGELQGFGKIGEIKTVECLIKAYSSVTNRAKAYREAAKEILPAHTKMPPFMLDQSSEQAWIDDIKNRIGIVAHESELKKLNNIKKKLEDRLSEEDKLNKTLEEIQNILLN